MALNLQNIFILKIILREQSSFLHKKSELLAKYHIIKPVFVLQIYASRVFRLVVLGNKRNVFQLFIVRNKIVVMDEATSNIDNKTDILIQSAVDRIFKNSTLITIAHKIPDLNKYDKIMILDEGRLIEYDTPFNLLKKNNGIFRQLYNCNLNVNK